MLSARALTILGLYAITTFNMVTKLVGLGGLRIDIIFFRPSVYRPFEPPLVVPAE